MSDTEGQATRHIVNFTINNNFAEATLNTAHMCHPPHHPGVNPQQYIFADGRFIKFDAIKVRRDRGVKRPKEWVIMAATIIPMASVEQINCHDPTNTSIQNHIRLWADYQKASFASEVWINFYQSKQQALPNVAMEIVDIKPPIKLRCALNLRVPPGQKRANFKPKEGLDVHVRLENPMESDSDAEDETATGSQNQKKRRTYDAKGVITNLQLDGQNLMITVQISLGASHEYLIMGLGSREDARYELTPICDMQQHKQLLQALTNAQNNYGRMASNPDAKRYMSVLDTFFGIRRDSRPLPQLDQVSTQVELTSSQITRYMTSTRRNL